MPSPLIAPITRVPSRPRLMRPLFSVRHSPRLTNRNGVLARMAPPSTASGTPHHPSASISRGPLLEDAKPPVQGLAGQDDQEDDSPHDQNGGVRQVMPSLHQAAARFNAAEQDRHRDHRQRSEERRVGKECRSRWSPYH